MPVIACPRCDATYFMHAHRSYELRGRRMVPKPATCDRCGANIVPILLP